MTLIVTNRVLPTLGSEFANMYANSLTPNTKRAYVKDVMNFFGVNKIENITLEAITKVNISSAQIFREMLLREGKALSTINRKITSLSNFYRVLCRREIKLMDFNPFDGSEGSVRVRQDKSYSNTRSLSTDEVKAMLAKTTEEDALAVRNRLIVLFLATSGMRRQEIVLIKIGDIKKNMGKDVVEILGKGGKHRLVVISGTVKALIDKYISMRGLTYKDTNKYLLTSHSTGTNPDNPISTETIRRVIKEVAGDAGIGAETVSPHSLRHTFATQSLLLGKNMEDVQDMMGHSDIKTTRRYDHTNRVINNSSAEQLDAMFTD
jgi:site-specific recombinase XerD